MNPKSETPAEKLRQYREMRDFAKTPEPSGAKSSSNGHSYLIQKHAATRLHYDFRLELGGVLLSWSVPKGPTLKAGEKRLAVRTEDHPLEYGDFEGVIPRGEYGGGTVLLWDKGSWEPEGDADAAVKRGRLTFDLHGEKLHGRFHLVRTGMPGAKENWLLFKSKDEFAVADGGEIVEAQPLSVVSGRSLEEIAGERDRVWHSNHDGPSLMELVRQIPTKVKLTGLDKVLWPNLVLTKAALVAYYASVSERLLKGIAGRPLVDGTKVTDLDGLLELAERGVREIEVMSGDEQVFEVANAAAARALREKLGVECFVKTTGGKGFHVVAPKGKRGRSKKSALAAYSPTRSRAALVSMPVEWDALDEVKNEDFSILTVPSLLSKPDPWASRAS